MRKITLPPGFLTLAHLVLLTACGQNAGPSTPGHHSMGGTSAVTNGGAAGQPSGSGATGAGGAAGVGGGHSAGGTAAGTQSAGGAQSTGGVPGAGGAGAVPSGGGSSGASFAGTSAGGTGALAGAAGGGGSGVGGSTAGGISGLMIAPNPNSVLSCIVSWQTAAAAGSTVDFGVAGYQWEISDQTPVTEHRVVVIGMHAQQTYMVKAVSGGLSAEGMFTTGKLPDTVPVGTVMIHDAAKTQPGWTLMNVQKGDGTTSARSASPPMAVMYDAEGLPVWYYIDGPNPDIGGAVSTQLTDKGVLIGPTWNTQFTTGIPPREVDFEGKIIWECASQACQPGKNVTHHASKLSNGDYVIIEYITTAGVQNPIFREVTPDNKEVWSLDFAALVPPPQGSTGDWCHANAITIDIANDAVWANCRWVGVLKTTYTNPSKVWLLPAKYGSKGLGDFTYSPSSSQYSDAHDPEIHEDDHTILLFDNGGYGNGAVGGTTAQFHSRAVEYKLDESAMTATLAWEFPGSFAVPDPWYTNNWYTPFWGDADRLANGNVLITGGIRSATVESRVFEVSKADGVVCSMSDSAMLPK